MSKVQRVKNPMVLMDTAYGNEFEKRGSYWYVKFSPRSSHYANGKWEKAGPGLVVQIEKMIHSGKIIEVERNPSITSRISEAYKDVKHAFTKKSQSAKAMRRLEEARVPARGGMVRPERYGLGEKRNPEYADLAYGNEFKQVGKVWYVRYSFRHPGHKEYGDAWVKVSPEMKLSIERMIKSGKIVKRNPESSASDLYEDFHGRAPSEIIEVHYEAHEHENLTALGALAQLKIITPFKKQCIINVVETKSPKTLPDPSQLPRDQRVFLCSNEEGNQLYFVGGDQEVDVYALGFSDEDVKDSMLLGVIDELTYQTEKGFDGFQTINYFHKLGEESGVEPVLIYDSISKLMSVSGGRYQVKPEGITD